MAQVSIKNYNSTAVNAGVGAPWEGHEVRDVSEADADRLLALGGFGLAKPVKARAFKAKYAEAEKRRADAAKAAAKAAKAAKGGSK